MVMDEIEIESESGDEPLTPAGRLFLQPEMNQIIHCVIGMKNPPDIESIKSEIKNSSMLKHPRFTSLMVRDHRGVEHWRPIKIDIDHHLRIIKQPLSDVDDESAINDYLADLSTTDTCSGLGLGLSMDKPLWEIHILIAHKCVIFRIHHSLGDGISLMSMLLASCRKVNDPEALPSIPVTTGTRIPRNFWNFLVTVWFCLIFAIELILRCLWIRDRKSPMTGGAGVELWPRKMATATFSLEHMKTVKRAVHNAEISNLMTSNSGARWGNKFGMILLPIYYHRSDSSDSLEYLKRTKAMIDRKKQSLEAHFSYKVGDFVMSTLGPKFASLLNYRILCNTTFTISNVIGPQEEIMIGGNPITFLRANNSALPHALILNMVSYAGRADMQVQVAKDIIPDPEFLAKCFEDALLEMKEQVTAKL
ncbi:wax ester synthase/diacylglycerol acyltransferase 3-like isoform X2 [Gastrolobium bilobum]|uniref:wax ester synthase/diacylglycerol acyltransferase 3-like isoform X2 n=1 Tax=Gastrolobium bilobum TaxID=150636 RepID=UPI002AB249FE|nr:wax ester synthase/diacylglycerol acyltransferase 3-like isoform X2 [Gastrolobium bilobum]